jgi:hypothetical protein
VIDVVEKEAYIHRCDSQQKHRRGNKDEVKELPE